jgi:Tfp pilus assembly protein PilZ
MTRLSTNNKTIERRTEERQFCSTEIFFATKNRLYEGRLENFSRSGLFIRTFEDFSIGEIITVAVPYIEGVDHKRQAQIIWENEYGIGVELFRSRDQSDPATIRLETKVNYYRLKVYAPAAQYIA